MVYDPKIRLGETQVWGRFNTCVYEEFKLILIGTQFPRNNKLFCVYYTFIFIYYFQHGILKKRKSVK